MGDAVAVPVAGANGTDQVTASIGGARLLPSPRADTTAWSNTGNAAVGVSNGTSTAAHRSGATARALAQKANFVAHGAALNTPTTVARFRTEGSAYAQAANYQPLFSRAQADAHGDISNLRLQALNQSANPTLNLNWDVGSLGAGTQPAASFAFSRHRITAIQTQGTNGGSGQPDFRNVTSLGFEVLSQNGHPAAISYDAPGSNTVRRWLAGSLQQNGGQLGLGGTPSGFTTKVPLQVARGLPDGVAQATNLKIKVSQTDYAAETPPTAVCRVGEQAGSHGGEGGVRWDPETGTLRFSSMPIDTLSDGTLEKIAGKYRKDALAGGKLQIDPLTYLGTLNGKPYFSGDKVRLLSGNGKTVFRASLPSVVLDRSLASKQGYDMYAPLLNINQIDPQSSVWLKHFKKRNQPDSRYLPELFLGLNTPDSGGNGLWKQGFRTTSEATLSFACKVPDPGTLWSLLAGTGALLLVGGRRRRAAGTARPA